MQSGKFNVIYNRENDTIIYYDSRYRNAPQWKEHGQPVSSYYRETIIEHGPIGLCLDGGNSTVWSTSDSEQAEIYNWAKAGCL